MKKEKHQIETKIFNIQLSIAERQLINEKLEEEIKRKNIALSDWRLNHWTLLFIIFSLFSTSCILFTLIQKIWIKVSRTLLFMLFRLLLVVSKWKPISISSKFKSTSSNTSVESFRSMAMLWSTADSTIAVNVVEVLTLNPKCSVGNRRFQTPKSRSIKFRVCIWAHW